MVCGAVHPALQQALYALDTLPRLTQAAVRTTLVAGCLGFGYLWYAHVYTLPRNEYNLVRGARGSSAQRVAHTCAQARSHATLTRAPHATAQVHPYTSWIPITLWAVLRNLTPTLRLNHLRLYGWLGCITLETYICQFHVWMRTDLPDGQPKALLVLLPGYPLLNFALVTAREFGGSSSTARSAQALIQPSHTSVRACVPVCVRSLHLHLAPPV